MKLYILVFYLISTPLYVNARPQSQSNLEEEWKKVKAGVSAGVSAGAGYVTKNVMQYYGAFTKSMVSDLWLSVLITFCAVFLAQLGLYILLRTVNCASRCLTCQYCRKRRR